VPYDYSMKRKRRTKRRERKRERREKGAFEANCKGSGGSVGRSRENLNFKRVRRL